LNELGFGFTYHMKELLLEESGISTDGHAEAWQAAAEGHSVDLRDLLSGWNSGVDFPVCAFPEALMETFPNARFILTTRPAKDWHSSISGTICRISSELFPFSVLSRILPIGPLGRLPEQTRMVASVCARPLMEVNLRIRSRGCCGA
jgi:hypothetical protein